MSYMTLLSQFYKLRIQGYSPAVRHIHATPRASLSRFSVSQAASQAQEEVDMAQDLAG